METIIEMKAEVNGKSQSLLTCLSFHTNLTFAFASDSLNGIKGCAQLARKLAIDHNHQHYFDACFDFGLVDEIRV